MKKLSRVKCAESVIAQGGECENLLCDHCFTTPEKCGVLEFNAGKFSLKAGKAKRLVLAKAYLKRYSRPNNIFKAKKVEDTKLGLVIDKKTKKSDTKKLSALKFWLLVKKNCVKGNHGCCFIACSICHAQGNEFLCKMCGDTKKPMVKECLTFAKNQIKILKGDNKKIVEEPKKEIRPNFRQYLRDKVGMKIKLYGNYWMELQQILEEEGVKVVNEYRERNRVILGIATSTLTVMYGAIYLYDKYDEFDKLSGIEYILETDTLAEEKVEEPKLKANKKLKDALDTGKMSIGVDLASGESKTITQEVKPNSLEVAKAIRDNGYQFECNYEETGCGDCLASGFCVEKGVCYKEAVDDCIKESGLCNEQGVANESIKEESIKETQETYERKAVCIDSRDSSFLVKGQVYDVVNISGDWVYIAYKNKIICEYPTSRFYFLPITKSEKRKNSEIMPEKPVFFKAVRCAMGSHYPLTVGTGYCVAEENEEDYKVCDDKGDICWYPKVLFDSLEQNALGKVVSCIHQDIVSSITIGKLYTVIAEDNMHYKINNDHGGVSWCPKDMFLASAQNKAYYFDNGKQYEITGETDSVYITKNDKGEVRHFRKDPMPEPVKINKPDIVYAVNGEYIKICHTKGRSVCLDSEGFLLVTTVDGLCRAYATPEQALQVAKKQWGVK